MLVPTASVRVTYYFLIRLKSAATSWGELSRKLVSRHCLTNGPYIAFKFHRGYASLRLLTILPICHDRGATRYHCAFFKTFPGNFGTFEVDRLQIAPECNRRLVNLFPQQTPDTYSKFKTLAPYIHSPFLRPCKGA